MERLSVTLKGGKGYEAPWIVFKGNSVDEVMVELEKLQNDNTLLRATAIVAWQFQGYVMSASGEPQPTQRQQAPTATDQWQPPPQQQSATPGPQRFCQECGGATEYREGTNAKGHWKGFFCANDKHKPQWVK
jgi:hypothetical protein